MVRSAAVANLALTIRIVCAVPSLTLEGEKRGLSLFLTDLTRIEASFSEE